MHQAACIPDAADAQASDRSRLNYSHIPTQSLDAQAAHAAANPSCSSCACGAGWGLGTASIASKMRPFRAAGRRRCSLRHCCCEAMDRPLMSHIQGVIKHSKQVARPLLPPWIEMCPSWLRHARRAHIAPAPGGCRCVDRAVPPDPHLEVELPAHIFVTDQCVGGLQLCKGIRIGSRLHRRLVRMRLQHPLAVGLCARSVGSSQPVGPLHSVGGSCKRSCAVNRRAVGAAGTGHSCQACG